MSSRKPVPPSKGPPTSKEPLGIRELDRFSEASLKKWSELSRDVDELHDVLYFGLEPERRRFSQEILAALQNATSTAVQIDRWVRIVTYQYCLAPLSSAGSLQQYGGRFNIGIDVDEGNLKPWPTLYLAEDFETSFRERFGLPSDERVDGLRPEELALEHGASHTAVFLRGSLSRLFDIREESCFMALATVLRRIKLPERATRLRKKLQIPPRGLSWHIHLGKCTRWWRSTTGACGPRNSDCRRRVTSWLISFVRPASKESFTAAAKGPATASHCSRTDWRQDRLSS